MAAATPKPSSIRSIITELSTVGADPLLVEALLMLLSVVVFASVSVAGGGAASATATTTAGGAGFGSEGAHPPRNRGMAASEWRGGGSATPMAMDARRELGAATIVARRMTGNSAATASPPPRLPSPASSSSTPTRLGSPPDAAPGDDVVVVVVEVAVTVFSFSFSFSISRGGVGAGAAVGVGGAMAADDVGGVAVLTPKKFISCRDCLLYTSDAADD